MRPSLKEVERVLGKNPESGVIGVYLDPEDKLEEVCHRKPASSKAGCAIHVWDDTPKPRKKLA